MCEISDFLVGIALAGIVGAIMFVTVAIILNNGFFTAPASPAMMVAAGVLSLAAVAALTGLLVSINEYFQCMGSPAECADELSQVTAAITALITVLIIQATACFVAAGVAWIPWAGAAPMYAIMATLILQLALLPTLSVFMEDLTTCASNVEADPVVRVLLAAVGVVALAAIGVTARVRKGLPWRWQAPK